MRDIRGYEVHEVETTSTRSKLLGAAVVALGLGALGVYAFASNTSTTGAQQVASNQVRTTPEGYQSQPMPPPVTPAPLDQKPVNPATPSKPQAGSQQAALPTPTALDGTPLDPKPAKEKQKPASEQQAAVKSKAPTAAPTPDMTPPENAQPTPPTQPAAAPEQPVPQETPAPTETPVPPQGQ